ncbi:MAG: lysophospholipid acyltransferase family protein [Verrucomicrobiales bacterium]|nr:lysophospholipid acyltransferase family protein [Verrucomicrobiales bacterium]
MWPQSEKIFSDYETSAKKPGWLSRTFPSPVYYFRAYDIVSRAAKLAKANRYDRAAWAQSSREVIQALESVGIRLKIENPEVIPNLKSPCVFVGNHMSTLETFVLPAMIQPHLDVTFVVKQSLVEYPIFKHVMRSCDPVLVNYKSVREDLRNMLVGGEERLAEGISMVVFPQGKRTTEFDAAKFNTLGIKIAKHAGVPIVPVALRTDAWGSNGRWVRDFGKMRPDCPVHFAFGEPLEVNGNGRHCQAEIVRFIGGKYQQWTEELPISEHW